MDKLASAPKSVPVNDIFKVYNDMYEKYVGFVQRVKAVDQFISVEGALWEGPIPSYEALANLTIQNRVKTVEEWNEGYL